jgi:hypothetical protein
MIMSRAYDAQQAALKAHPDDREAAIDLFIGYLNFDLCDFEYEFGMSVEKYIFGDEKLKADPDQ